MSNRVVLDTSAIIALLEDEEGADTVEQHLRDAEGDGCELFCSFVTLTELRYVTIQEQGAVEADRLLGLVSGWPVQWVHSEETICRTAADLKAEHRISLADAFVAATASTHDATLVHKDPEFEPLADEIDMASLPYKGAPA